MRRNPNPDPHPSLRDAVDVTRFWGLVQRAGPDECWPWQGYLDDDGYGLFVWHGRRTGAHSLALSFSTGELRGSGLDTCHSCDVPSCCNPAHLRFDTRLGNVADMIERGRGARPGLRLTDEQVRQIRERRAAGAPQKVLGAQFGVSGGWISMIVSGRARVDAGGPTTQVSNRESS